MSVYTTVSSEALGAWLADYALGDLVELKGIASGIENTNYFVTTTHGRYVLTLFEKLTRDELPFYLDLMAHLADHGIPCPTPIASITDGYLGTLNGKPASIVTCLKGQSLEVADEDACRQVGDMLAALHLSGRGFSQDMPNPRGRAWRKETGERLVTLLDGQQSMVLREELAYQADVDWNSLPQGVIHADLFRDNVLFEAGRLSGVIDFYYACKDALVYDLAVTVNDWCCSEDGCLDIDRANALVAAYRRHRDLEPMETALWAPALRAAALRFWLSRLLDQHFPRPGELTHAKDPGHFYRLLCYLQQHLPKIVA